MTDDLIKRLRDEHVAASRTEAADRIDALTAERDKYEAAWMTAEGKLADVEAERDRMREALADCAQFTGICGETARAALNGESQ